MFVKGFKNQFDRWSIAHFLGPFLLCFLIDPKWIAIGIVGWEILDLIWHFRSRSNFYRFNWDKIFDRRGISWGDLLLGFLGIGLYYLFMR